MGKAHEEKLAVVRERTFALNPRLATVGWFSRSGSLDACITLSDLRVVVLEKTVESGEWALMSVPAVCRHGCVDVSGRWYAYPGKGCVRFSTEAAAGCKPAGVRKSLSRKDNGLSIKNDADCKLIDCAYEMTDGDALEAQSKFNKFGDDFLSVPTFLAPIPARGYVSLRQSEALDRAVLHSAKFGRWHLDVPGLVAPSHGKAERLSSREVRFTHADRDGDPCAVEETIVSPAMEVKQLIYKTFGVEPVLDLVPAPAEGESLWLQPPQCLFLPVQKGSFKLADLAKHPNYQAMRYMAALNSGESQHGLAMLDYAVACSDLVPWVHMTSLPSRIVRVKRTQSALCSTGSDHKVFLHNLGQTLTHMSRRLSRPVKEASLAKPPTKDAQPLREGAEVAGT